MMSLWDALRMNMMISYQELVRTFLKVTPSYYRRNKLWELEAMH
ncbi:Transposon Tn10 TetD protein [Escherichia coli]|nr:Transposon Tn10 TetD protein [Escherichia coli]